jgi:ribonuclease HI
VKSIELDEKVCLYIYTDGACSGTPGPAGSGVVFIQDSKTIYEISKSIGIQTNNYAELMAIYLALEKVKKYPDIRIILVTDSKYCIGMIVENWRPQVNISLILKIKKLKNKFRKLTFKHCRGHMGIWGNELADRLAVRGKRMNESKDLL